MDMRREEKIVRKNVPVGLKRQLYQETVLAASKELEKNQFPCCGRLPAEENEQKKAEPHGPALFLLLGCQAELLLVAAIRLRRIGNELSLVFPQTGGASRPFAGAELVDGAALGGLDCRVQLREGAGIAGVGHAVAEIVLAVMVPVLLIGVDDQRAVFGGIEHGAIVVVRIAK